MEKVKQKKLLNTDVFVNLMEDNVKMSKNKIEKIHSCGDFLRFYTNETRSVHTLAGGMFCNDRFCPICSWRMARKNAFHLLELLEYARVKEQKEFIFLTLTAPNVSAEKLKSEITDFNESFKRLTKIKDFFVVSKGYIRKLEVTYNAERKDYHPHFHIIVAVNKSYFTDKAYISRQKWLEMWKKAKRDESITQVDIRKIKMDTIKEVMEMATYSTKHKDLYLDEVFPVIYKCLKGRQLLTFNGLFKDLRRLQLDGELEVDDLDRLNEQKEIVDTEIFYKWENQKKDYTEWQERPLTRDELKRIYNTQLEFE